jgi:hypothetical protein
LPDSEKARRQPRINLMSRLAPFKFGTCSADWPRLGAACVLFGVEPPSTGPLDLGACHCFPHQAWHHDVGYREKKIGQGEKTAQRRGRSESARRWQTRRLPVCWPVHCRAGPPRPAASGSAAGYPWQDLECPHHAPPRPGIRGQQGPVMDRGAVRYLLIGAATVPKRGQLATQ